MKATPKRMGSLSLKSVIVSFILLLLLPSLSYGKNIRVTIIPSSKSSAYTTTANHIKSAINNNSNNVIKINTTEAKDLYYKKSTIIKDTDLFVAIGQHALKEILKYSGDTPVLASLVSESDFITISDNFRSNNKILNIGAIFIDQPIKRNIRFSKLVLPNSNRLGFIISEANKSTINKLNSLTDNNNYHIEILKPGTNVISSLARALGSVDVIIALPDPIVFNLRTTRNILLSTYRKRIPIIGFSKSYAKAGALAAIYSTPEHIGKQTGEYISHIYGENLEPNKKLNLSRFRAKYFSISVNNSVAHSLGIPKLDAVDLEKKLLRIEEGPYD